MRKQDRIEQQRQNRQSDSSSKQSSQPQPPERERMKGSASDERPPARHPGEKLPLPD
jgi:hypothetical protein